MSTSTLTPAEKAEVNRFGLHDEDVLAWHETHQDDVPACEAPTGCEQPAYARFVVDCPCRKIRLGCEPHVTSTALWFDNGGVIRCKQCQGLVLGYQVVPL